MPSWFRKLFGGSGSEGDPAEEVLEYQVRGAVLPLQAVAVSKAEAAWAAQRNSAQGTLIIVADPESHPEIREEAAEDDPAEVLAEAASLDADLVLQNLAADGYPEQEDDQFESIISTDPSQLSARPGRSKFITLNTRLLRPKRAYLVDVPCKEPWAVFAYVPFGEWNSVPSDAVLTAIFKSWYERFGAVPAYVGGDVIEFWVDRPVTDAVAACELAKEMYAMCPDNVDQGVGTVQNLAQALLNASTWYFWWD